MILPNITQNYVNDDHQSNIIMEMIDTLAKSHIISQGVCEYLLDHISMRELPYLMMKARELTDQIYGKEIFFRGLIEITNVCSQGCYYCGLQSGNNLVNRYRMSETAILSTVEEGYQLGFRSFVWQGGEDAGLTDEWLCSLIRKFRADYPDCVVTLSIGERSRASYQALYDSGLDRCLLRHESASKSLYEKLHPQWMSFDHRMQCLQDLKDIGYWVGAGFLINPPFQKNADLVEDLMFIQRFQPHMCGIGPFIPHPDTKFRDEEAGYGNQTAVMLALVRLIVPEVLLPATTALATVDALGRSKGLNSGGNVVMPNLTAPDIRKLYEIYAQKKNWGDEAAENVKRAIRDIEELGYIPALTRGDHISYKEK
ncbi:MAG: biotin synthetase [Erysipelotrichaceae bacterium]|nr:MAG: biotin [Erysipelotrichaceae bacterium]TXT17139.1 MAG: biotin synthetase [Erysipelotrichaceae bacterium]